jgi:hypothetical protein
MLPGTLGMKAIDCDLSNFLKDYRYQPELTPRLDLLDSQPFTQAVINEIVLWKVNRYAALSSEALEALNSVVRLQPGAHRSAREVIVGLLSQHGVDLPMASTLLRFRNPKHFRSLTVTLIVCIRHRFAAQRFGTTQGELYLKYLDALVELARAKKVKFHELDRILYEFDRTKNGQL